MAPSGQYSVLLGDATLPNMTALPPSVFTNTDVRLRVWFNDGAHGSQLLTPDQLIAAWNHELSVGEVPDAVITGASSTADPAADLDDGSQNGMSIGGPGVSPENTDTVRTTGHLRSGGTTTGEAWQQLGLPDTPPVRRDRHTAIWTGSEMIVWGGFTRNRFTLNRAVLNDTFSYTPPPSAVLRIASVVRSGGWNGGTNDRHSLRTFTNKVEGMADT